MTLTVSMTYLTFCFDLIAGEVMSRQCYFGQFKCATHGCVDLFKLCDGVNDCDDASDELGCGL